MSSRCKVLIVDDELLVRQGMKHHLNWEQEGFELVGEASNGQEALAFIEHVHPHIIITDIVMPVMDGEELTRIVKNRYPEIEIIILSSFSEFDYVKSTFQSGVVDYILKPKLETEELLHVLKKTAAKIPSLKLDPNIEVNAPSLESIVEKVMAGYAPDEDQHVLEEAFPYERFYLFACSTKPVRQQSGYDGEQLRHRILKHVHQSLSIEQNANCNEQNANCNERNANCNKQNSNYNEQNASCNEQLSICRVEPEPHLSVYLINISASSAHHVIRAARDTQITIAKEAPGLCWALTNEFHSWKNIADVYKEQLQALLQYRFYLPDYPILIASELPAYPELDAKFNLDRFSKELKSNQAEHAFQELMTFVQDWKKRYRTDIYEFKSFLSNMIFTITILMNSMEMDTAELEENKYAYFRGIDEAHNAEQTIEQLRAFLHKASDVIASHEHRGSSNMKKLLEYIQEHYAEPLNLSEMAKHFHFNPSYLSSYFTTHNKEGFNEYLNRIRIEKAEELLRAGQVSISEISNLVGYSDHSYFCKVFKKFTGLSPSHYRRKHHH